MKFVELLRRITNQGSYKYKLLKFLKTANSRGNLLDVGCSDWTASYIKLIYPDVFYTGIDVVDIKPEGADKFIEATPENFAEVIADSKELFDTVISLHNLEHCNDREKTLDAMIKVLNQNGVLLLAFPTEKSVDFPNRKGTLNYYDDSSHKNLPPNFEATIEKLKSKNMKIIFCRKSYKPLFFYLIGLLMEWKSKKDKQVKPGTWAYWGFEAIIWARKQ